MAESLAMPGMLTRTGTSHRGRSAGRLRWAAALGAAVPALLFTPLANAQATTKVVSKRYAYSIVLPGGSSRWTVNFATANWSGPVARGAIDSTAIDDLSDQLTGRSYLLAARPSGLNLQRWAKLAISVRSPSCGAPQALANATLAGAAGRVFTWSCTNGYRGIMIAALHSGRGYFMLVASPANLSRSSDQSAFDVARHSFRFLRT